MTTQTLQTALMAGLNLVAPVAPTTTTLPILQTLSLIHISEPTRPY